MALSTTDVNVAEICQSGEHQDESGRKYEIEKGGQVQRRPGIRSKEKTRRRTAESEKQWEKQWAAMGSNGRNDGRDEQGRIEEVMERERREICSYNTTYCFELSVGNIVCFTQ
jgi:hypothetical protein